MSSTILNSDQNINPRLKKVTICASEAKPNRRGKAPVLKEEHHCRRARAAETRESPVDFRSAKQVNGSEPGTMKIDLAKPQPADCHLFEARVNKLLFLSERQWPHINAGCRLRNAIHPISSLYIFYPML